MKSKLIWVIECWDDDGNKECECYLYKWVAQKQFYKYMKDMPEYHWALSGQPLYLF